jgi:hypothetical protein
MPSPTGNMPYAIRPAGRDIIAPPRHILVSASILPASASHEDGEDL